MYVCGANEAAGTVELGTKECRRIRRLFNAVKISFFVSCIVTLSQNLRMFITEFYVTLLFLLKESGGIREEEQDVDNYRIQGTYCKRQVKLIDLKLD